jgi:acetyl esterase
MPYILPQVQALLDQMRVLAQPKLKDLPLDMARAAASLSPLDLPARTLPWQDDSLAGVPVRLYRPETARPGAVFIFYHGGGWVIGDRNVYHSLASHIAAHLDMALVSVDYRLAPEHAFPAAHDDCIAVTRAVLDGQSPLGAVDHVLVGGDSAGGNLAAVVAQQFRERIHGQWLAYPVTDVSASAGSMEELGSGYFLEKIDMDWFYDLFVPIGVDRKLPKLSPLYGDLAGLPPAVVITCGLDPLRDQGLAYGDALKAAGTEVSIHSLDGIIHGAFSMRQLLPPAQDMLLTTLSRLDRIAR